VPGGKFWSELVRQLERLAPPGLWLAALAAGIATSSVRRLPDGSRRRYDGPRPYDLSHTFVSLLIQEGRSLAYVAEQAGHTFEECVRTYTDLFDEYRDARPVPAEDLIHVLPCKSKAKPTEGFEPSTPALRERCSGQLSYVGAQGVECSPGSAGARSSRPRISRS
jgi:hypothetical protein